MSSGMKPSIWGFSSAGSPVGIKTHLQSDSPATINSQQKTPSKRFASWILWGISSAGRALAWHARGHRFDPGILHQKSTAQECAVLFCCVCPAMQLLNSCWTFAESYGIILSAIAGIVHRLVYQPSKLRRWVRFPLPAPTYLDAGSLRIGVFLYALTQFLTRFYIFGFRKRF